MEAISINNLFQGQLDYVFFFQGLAFFLISVVCLFFRGQKNQQMPWLWLGLFGLFQGLAAWTLLLAVSFGQQTFLKVFAAGLKMVSLICLTEFGRTGFSRTRGQDGGWWLLTLLLMITGFGGLKGWPGILLAGGYALGLIGGLWATAALMSGGQAGEDSRPNSRWLASGCLGLLALTIALFPAPSFLFPASFLNQEVFFKWTGLPLEFCQGLLAFGLAAGIYGFVPVGEQAGATNVSRYRSRYMGGLLLTLALILGLGSMLTQYLGEMALEKIKTEANEYSSIVVSRLNTEFKRMEDAVRAIAESPWMSPVLVNRSDGNLERANTTLDRYKEAVEASVCYLMDRKGKTIASSNRRASDSFVGHSYAFRPYFTQAINGAIGRYFAVGVTSKVPGYYVSYPVKAPTDRVARGVAVIKVTLDNVTKELQASVQKGYSLICLADPHGVVFLSSQPDLVFKSLWPNKEEDRAALLQQFGKDWFPAIFSNKINDGEQVHLDGRQYLASFAGTFHAGWSVYFFRPIERIGIYRLTGITVASLLSLLALLFWGSNFYVRERAALSRASEELFRDIFDVVPEAVMLVDPETHQILETNMALVEKLNYAKKDLQSLRLEALLTLEPREVQEQLEKIIQAKHLYLKECQVRRTDGTPVVWDMMGVSLESGGRSLVLLLGREPARGAQDRRLDGKVREFNNLLASLIMQTELTLEEVPAESKLHRNLEDILTSALQARELLHQRSDRPVPVNSAPGTSKVRGEHILLVDDEEKLIRLEEKVLNRLGYRVSAFTDSLAALEAFHLDPKGFDLVISDCSMSQLPGLDLARELLQVRPDLPIILATGLSDAHLHAKAAELGIRECLEKPILSRDLDKTIRKVLDVHKNSFSPAVPIQFTEVVGGKVSRS